MKNKNNQDIDMIMNIFNKLDNPSVLFKLKDTKPIIIDVNDKFSKLFIDNNDNNDNNIKGKNLNKLTVPKKYIKEAKNLDKISNKGGINNKKINRMTNKGIKKFNYTSINVDDNLVLGIYEEITCENIEKEYINVIQRVLRHNMRNDLNIIKGYSNVIKEKTDDDELNKYITNIIENLDNFEKISNQTKQVKKIIDKDYNKDKQDILINDVVSDVISDVISEYNNATVGINFQENIHVKSCCCLKYVFKQLIENGIKYNDSKEPTVMIQGHKSKNGMIHITISDNGVGIPELEKKIITDDKKINQLEHSSGLGLWVTKWVVQSNQGYMNIYNNPITGGSVIELWLNC